MIDPPVPIDTNPYVGPWTFTYEQRDLFFGREHEARDLLARVISSRHLLFYAQSGAGKSSLLNTRLIPHLRTQANFIVLPTGRVSGILPPNLDSVDNIFIFNLLTSLDNSDTHSERLAHVTLTDFLSHLISNDGQTWRYDPDVESTTDESSVTQRYALIIDQFEEIITNHTDRWAEREDFFRQLNTALRIDPSLWVVLTLREDYLAGLDPYAQYMDDRLSARFSMQRMDAHAALEAVRRPAEKFERPFAPGVAEELVDNLCRVRVFGQGQPQPGQYVEPMQLQVVCRRLWQDLSNQPLGQITRNNLQGAGDVDTALADYYEQTLRKVLQASRIDVSEHELRDWFSTKLITPEGTRGLVHQDKDSTGGLPNGAVQELSRQFLIREEERGGGLWYELVHDRFVEPILQANKAWQQAEDQSKPWMSQMRLWLDTNRSSERLLSGALLADAQRYADEHPRVLSNEEREFLKASADYEDEIIKQAELRERELAQAQALAEEQRRRAELEATMNRRLRQQLFGLVFVLLVASVTALIAITQYLAAQQQKAAAVAAQFTAEANRQEAVDQQTTAVAAQSAAEANRREAVNQKAVVVVAQSAAEANRQKAERGAITSAALFALAGNDRDQALALALATIDPTTGEAPIEAIPIFFQAADSFAQYCYKGHTGGVLSVAYSPDGKTAISGSADHTLRLWDVSSGLTLRIFTGHTDHVNAVAFSPDGMRVLSGSDDQTLRLWDIVSGQILRTFSGHTGPVNAVAFSPDGTKVLSGSTDKTLQLWDVDSGNTLHAFKGHTGFVYSVAFSPNGNTILSGSADQTLQLWDVKSERSLHTFSGHSGSVWSVAFSPDGKQVLSGSGDWTLQLWDASSGQPLKTFDGHKDRVWSVAFSPDGKTILSGSKDQTVRLWDVETGQLLRTFIGHQGDVRSVSFNPKDNTTALSSSTDGDLRLWGIESYQRLRTFTGHTDAVLSVAVKWNAQAKMVLSGSKDGTMQLWDITSGQLLQTFTGHTGPVYSVAFSPDGKTVLSGSYDRTLRLWNIATGQTLQTFKGHKDLVWSVAFSPDGKTALSGSYDQTLRLWDIANGQILQTFTGHTGPVYSVAFSPNGKTALSGSDDQTLRLWDIANGQILQTFTGHTGPVYSVTFSPDGKTALSGSDDRTLRLWDIATGKNVTFEGHNGAVYSVAFSPDGKTALSGSYDQTLRLWDIASGQILRTFTGYTASVESVAFSPDGKTALSGSDDKTMRLWPIESLADLVSWVRNHRYVPELSCQTRAHYNIQPLCSGEDGTAIVTMPTSVPAMPTTSATP